MYAAGDDLARLFTVMTYGPHAVHAGNRDYQEVPVATLAWANTADDALAALQLLSRQPAAPLGYPAAAQLECLLAELDRDLTGIEGHPVLVTVGARSPYPPHVDPSAIIPCRWRNDWRVRLGNLLTKHAGMAFGAVHDTGWPDELWRRLGRDAATTIGDFSAPRFVDALGLTTSDRQLIPIPLIAETETPGTWQASAAT